MNVIVLKLGGSIMAKLPESFYKILVELKRSGQCEPIIVHGGGPEINQTLKRMQVESTFIDGLRVTTKEVLNVAEMVMSGSINKKIVTDLLKAGTAAIGISGVDNSLLQTEPIDETGKMGYVGKVINVNTSLLTHLMNHGSIPVISPIGIDAKGQHYNINGDIAAAAVASAIKGNLVLISDIPGVMEDVNNESIIHKQLTETKIEALITAGVIHGGMIPKVRSALQGLAGGVEESVIINGLSPTDLKRYIQGEEVGTKIIKEEFYHV
ncbi:acetylglutamate kinase [Oceanobacillus sp. 143]|uniref:Acetylglutamate kinase n=1 Tax=Oceanobacillus zhaokaii TaxID=2052660 RepID=A0A345PF68_9BACI|nr:acetylglutamate kinase [Oceanobacillus zhaokaii]AXI08648.1 acetylglutamate kinase [Oceanobacillus zhaokaii]QGS68424.1 acetylglutamate kinase [Oceanobacillus sp. 143]